MRLPGKNLFRQIWTLALALILSVSAEARQSPLIDAAKAGAMTEVRDLLGSGAAPEGAEADGTTALHWVALHDDAETAALLVESGADATAANRLGVTPLHLAATNGNAALIQQLIDAGADPNTTLPGGETVLMNAAKTGDVDAVNVLLENGADPERREDWRGQTALMWAAAENNAGAIRALVEAGADLDATSNGGVFTAFMFAVRGGHIEATGELLEARADVNRTMPDGMSPLVLAILNAHYELAALLLDHGADPNADAQGWTPLHQVAWSRRPNAGFNLPGAAATGNLDSLDLVRKLVAHGADLDRRMTKEPGDGNRNMLNRIGSTPFLMAAKGDDVPLMRLLVELGADPSLTNEDGTTALMVAAGVGIWAPGESPGTHEEALAAVRLALEVGGGSVTDIDANGETALHGAVYRGGAIPVIQFLADQGSPLDIVNAKGWTPLFAAEGVEYTPAVLKRYPEAAALLRDLMSERGLPIPEPGRPLASEASLAPADPVSNLAGVFTEAQANRGERLYRETCASCHFDDLAGDASAPALVGPEFWGRWEGSTLNAMVELTRTSMPPAAPGSLGNLAYRDLVSYVLRENGSPAGEGELPDDAIELERILLTNPEPPSQ